MTRDARRALTRLLNAFENHFDIARDGDEADDAAELALRDAFFTYDDILFTQLGVELPFDILDDSDDEDDYDDEEEDEEEDDDDEEEEDDDFIEVDD